MEEVKIFFIILGTFFMREQPSLVAQKATISVDPLKREILIVQENLLSTTDVKDVVQTEEYQKIKANQINWVEELEGFKNKRVDFEESGETVNARISFNYTDPKELSTINIASHQNSFSVFQDEKLAPLTGEHYVEEPYLVFSSKSPFSFTVGIFDEWLDPDSDAAMFIEEFTNQPLVAKKSDVIKGKTFTQTPTVSSSGNKSSNSEKGFKIFFAEDQDFALINDELEIEVNYLDNNTVLIPVTQDIGPLKKGDNYFEYVIDKNSDGLALIPLDKSGKKKSENVVNLQSQPERAY